MKRLLLLPLLAAGCSPAPSKPSEEPPAVVAIVPTPAEVKPDPPPEKPKTPPAEPFRFPSDPAGKQVEHALFPPSPAPPVPGVTGPKGRSSAITRGELPAAKPAPTLTPAVVVPARKLPGPSAPTESLPGDLGLTADLSGFRLPESKPVRVPGRPQPTAADVPPSARQWAERASVEDPSAELSAERIVRTRMLPPSLLGPLLKLVVPDPFELAEQVRPPMGPELGTTPVDLPRP